MRCATHNKNKETKHAPPIPLELAMALEPYAVSDAREKNIRFYGAGICLLLVASLRFSDAVEVQKFRVTRSAVCGISVDQKYGKR